MIQIRQNVFETNSSSTHSIAIPKKCDKILNQIFFRIGEYGWENDTVYDTASYLYTAILNAYNPKEANDKLGQLTDILNKNNIAYKFEKPRWIEPNYDVYYDVGYYEYGYVDHAYELCEFIDALLDNEDMLLRFLACGVVYTGNDNQDCRPDGCNIADDYIWEYDDMGNETCKPNPYHDEENFDYFYKGN